MIRPKRLLLLACILLASGGCSSMLRNVFGPPRPALERYRLSIPSSVAEASPTRVSVLPGALSIAPYITRGIYDGRGIAYRIDDFRLEPYASREWAIPLRDMLGEVTETVLKAHPLTAEPATFDPRSPRSYEYQWRGTVIEFEEVDRGRQVLAAVHLDAELIRTANDSVVWRGSERIEGPVPEPTNAMPSVVEALSTLTAEVITRLVEQARTALAVPTAAAAPPPR